MIDEVREALERIKILGDTHVPVLGACNVGVDMYEAAKGVLALLEQYDAVEGAINPEVKLGAAHNFYPGRVTLSVERPAILLVKKP